PYVAGGPATPSTTPVREGRNHIEIRGTDNCRIILSGQSTQFETSQTTITTGTSSPIIFKPQGSTSRSDTIIDPSGTASVPIQEGKMRLTGAIHLQLYGATITLTNQTASKTTETGETTSPLNPMVPSFI